MGDNKGPGLSPIAQMYDDFIGRMANVWWAIEHTEPERFKRLMKIRDRASAGLDRCYLAKL